MLSSVRLWAQTDDDRVSKILELERGKYNLSLQMQKFISANDSISTHWNNRSDSSAILENRKRIAAIESGIADIDNDIDLLKRSLRDSSSSDNQFFEYHGSNDQIDKDYFYDYKDQDNYCFDSHCAGFALGFNNLISDNEIGTFSDYSFFNLNSGRSIEFDFVCCELPIRVSFFSAISLAIQFSFNHYSFQNIFDLKTDDNNVVFPDYNSVLYPSAKRFNLRTSWIGIPLTYEYQFDIGNDQLFCYVGVVAMARIGCRTKQIFKINKREKNVVRDDFETNTFRYDLMAGFGFNHYGFSVKYSPVSLFKYEHGPNLYPVALCFNYSF